MRTSLAPARAGHNRRSSPERGCELRIAVVLVDVANAVYIYGHWPLLITESILLLHFRRDDDNRVRNVILLTSLAARRSAPN